MRGFLILIPFRYANDNEELTSARLREWGALPRTPEQHAVYQFMARVMIYIYMYVYYKYVCKNIVILKSLWMDVYMYVCMYVCVYVQAYAEITRAHSHCVEYIPI